jgi:hypothetical protein
VLLERMVARQSVCLRRLSQGDRAQEVAFGRFLANDKVTAERVIEGWSAQAAVAGRHVLAIQDTSEVNFKTKPDRRRGLGEIGKGSGRGVLVHAMVAVDAATGACLGLVAGTIYTRQGRVEIPHAQRKIEDKESRRWIDTAQQAKPVLAQAAMITVVSDRESDIYTGWTSIPEANVHMLTRVMHDRAVKGGGTLARVIERHAFVATRTIELLATPKRQARRAMLSLRFCSVDVMRPKGLDGGQPKTVTLRLVEVIERNPPEGVEAVHWRLLTTHDVDDVAMAWQIVDWYRLRWTIEQLFRLMKTQGLQLEDSQLASAEGLIKLAAIATKAAVTILQLVQARNGKSQEPAEIAFSEAETAVLDGLNHQIENKRATSRKNPHPHRSLAWATWIIGRLGGWDGYPSSKPPGPITLRHGLEYFHAVANGWALRDVCMP